MVATRIRDLTLHEVQEAFQIQATQELSFFPELQGEFPSVSDRDRAVLEQIQADYLYMTEDVPQNIVSSPSKNSDSHKHLKTTVSTSEC